MIHLQVPTPGWLEAVEILPDRSLVKAVDQGQVFLTPRSMEDLMSVQLEKVAELLRSHGYADVSAADVSEAQWTEIMRHRTWDDAWGVLDADKGVGYRKWTVQPRSSAKGDFLDNNKLSPRRQTQ